MLEKLFCKSLFFLNLWLWLIIFSSTVWSFQLPRFIFEQKVINEEKKLCGLYYSDSGKSPPAGWTVVNEPKTYINFKLPWGECVLDLDYWNKRDYEAYLASCCAQLGLQYIDYHQIPYTTGEVIKPGEKVTWLCKPNYGRDYNAILINLKQRQCAISFDFKLSKHNQSAYPTEGQCQITDIDWQLYENEKDKTEAKIIITSTVFGDCVNTSWEQCCKEHGWQYVGEELKKNYLAHAFAYLETKVFNNFYLKISVLIFLSLLLIVLLLGKKLKNIARLNETKK